MGFYININNISILKRNKISILSFILSIAIKIIFRIERVKKIKKKKKKKIKKKLYNIY
jgi:hypothetical protein